MSDPCSRCKHWQKGYGIPCPRCAEPCPSCDANDCDAWNYKRIDAAVADNVPAAPDDCGRGGT